MISTRAKVLLVLGGLALLVWGMATTPWQNVDGSTGKPVHAVTHYEDGSNVAANGTVTCTPGGLCDDTRTITAAGCTYHVDGSGRCGAEAIPPLAEYDADFCNDIDPGASVIYLCRKGR